MADLYMQTGEMAAYQAGEFASQQQWTKVTSLMKEGEEFAKKDAVTSQAFQKYGTDANTGLQEYTNKAASNRLDYLGTEADNALLLDRINFASPGQGG